MAEQSYATHSRYHPWFHFFAIPVLTINVLVTLYFAIRYVSFVHVWFFVVAVALLTIAFLVRVYALRNQDRIIRLEETLRMMRLLPPDLQARMPELRMRHYTSLRFCSDEELPDVTRAVLSGELKTPKEIKQRIRNWRPDYHRC